LARPQDCIDETKLKDIFKEVKRGYLSIVRKVSVWSPNTEILLQGYDFAIPRSGGKWMGVPLASLGYSLENDLPAKIIGVVVDQFYTLLTEVAQTSSRVHVMNNRNQLWGHWHDELHPDKVAATKVANKYIEKMLRLRAVA
jgi:hypothetical protein